MIEDGRVEKRKQQEDDGVDSAQARGGAYDPLAVRQRMREQGGWEVPIQARSNSISCSASFFCLQVVRERRTDRLEWSAWDPRSSNHPCSTFSLEEHERSRPVPIEHLDEDLSFHSKRAEAEQRRAWLTM